MTNIQTGTLEQELIRFTQIATSTVESGAAFAKEQIPQVIQELLSWHFAGHCGYVLFFVVLMVLVASCFRHVCRNHPDDAAEYFWVFLAVFILLSFAIAYNASIAAKIKIAPKVYILEQAAEIIKKGRL